MQEKLGKNQEFDTVDTFEFPTKWLAKFTSDKDIDFKAETDKYDCVVGGTLCKTLETSMPLFVAWKFH